MRPARLRISKERFGVSLKERKSTGRVFLLTLAVTVLAKGASFLPGYSIDDYALVLQDVPPERVLLQGRFGQAALIHGFRLLGLEPHFARVFFVAFALLVSALLATLIVRQWNLRRAGWLPAAAASIISIHPFTTEIFTFRTALGFIMVSLALFGVLLVPRRWSLAGVAAGAVLFALTLSSYQGILQYCGMVILLSAAVGLTRVLIAGSAAGWPRRITSLLSWRRILRHENTALLACAALGSILYLVLNAVVIRLLRIAMGQRFGLLPLDRIDDRAHEVLRVLEYRFLEWSPLLNRFAKGMFLLLVLAALAGLLVRARPWILRWQSVLFPLAIAALLAASLIWTVGILMVPPTFWPVPRVMSHVGILWAAALAIAYLCAGRRARWALGLLALTILLSFIGSDNRILHDQLRLNQRDMAKASRIIARLEALPGFSGAEEIVVHGTASGYPLSYATADMDMNLSAFNADWAKVAILREVSGYDLKEAQSRGPKAAAYCKEVQPWPGPQSVTLQDGLAIVCLRSE